MREDEGDRHSVSAHESGYMMIEGGQLRVGRRLQVEIAETHHADIAGVVVFDMGALVDDGSSFPDSTCAINDVVVADISPISAEVSLANQVEPGFRIGFIGLPERGHAVVVDGDAVNAGHGVKA